MNTPTETEMRREFRKFCGLDATKEQRADRDDRGYFLLVDGKWVREPNRFNSIDALQGVIERMNEEQHGKLWDLLDSAWRIDSDTCHSKTIWLLTLKPIQLAPLVYEVIKEGK